MIVIIVPWIGYFNTITLSTTTIKSKTRKTLSCTRPSAISTINLNINISGLFKWIKIYTRALSYLCKHRTHKPNPKKGTRVSSDE